MPTRSSSLDPPFLTWSDIGATGTDERLDYVIEVAVVVTRFDIEMEELGALGLIISPGGDRWKARLSENPALSEFHARSGLLAEVDTHGVSLYQAEQALVQTLARFGQPQDFMGAGTDTAISTGRRFLRASMPKLETWMRPANFNVSTLETSLRLLGKTPPIPKPRRKRKQHRLIDDIQTQIEAARLYLGEMQ